MRITGQKGFALIVTDNGPHVVSYELREAGRRAENDVIRFDREGSTGAWWEVTQYNNDIGFYYCPDDEGQQFHYPTLVLATAEDRSSLPSAASLGVPPEVPEVFMSDSIPAALQRVVELVVYHGYEPEEIEAARAFVSHYPCIYNEYVKTRSVADAQKAVIAQLFA